MGKPSLEELWRALNAPPPADQQQRFKKSAHWNAVSQPIRPPSAIQGARAVLQDVVLNKEASLEPQTALKEGSSHQTRDTQVNDEVPKGEPTSKESRQQVVSKGEVQSGGLASSSNGAHPDLKSSLQRDVNALADPSSQVRYAALQRIQSALLAVPPGALQELAEGTIAKPMLRRLGDHFGKCREVAAAILLGIITITPNSVLALLPYLMPTLSERLALKDSPRPRKEGEPLEIPSRGRGPIEQSEEVRLLLAQLLSAVVRTAGKALGPYGDEVAAMIVETAGDPAPEIAQEVCSCCVEFCALFGVRLRPSARALVAAFLPCLKARRQKVRSSGIRALQKLIFCGISDEILALTAFRDPNLVPIKAFYHAEIKTNWMALLAGDSSVAVRMDFLHMLKDWLLHLPERQDYEPRLLPYVLAAFNDQASSVQKEAFYVMELIGKLYEQERETELKDTLQYLSEDIATSSSQDELTRPFPITRRPSLGARICVRGCLSRQLYPLIAELQSWTEPTKKQAALLLRNMLIYAEEHVTIYLQPVLMALCQRAEDPDINSIILECATLIGHFVEAPLWAKFILPQCTNSSKSGPLSVLAALISGTSKGSLHGVVGEIMACLTDPSLLESRDPLTVRHVGSVANALAKKWTPGFLGESCAMAWVLTHLLTSAGKEISEVENSLDLTAIAEGFSSGRAFLSCHLAPLLDLVPPPSEWTPRSTPPSLFCTLLRRTCPETSQLWNRLLEVLQACRESPAFWLLGKEILHSLQALLETTPLEKILLAPSQKLDLFVLFSSALETEGLEEAALSGLGLIIEKELIAPDVLLEVLESPHGSAVVRRLVDILKECERPAKTRALSAEVLKVLVQKGPPWPSVLSLQEVKYAALIGTDASNHQLKVSSNLLLETLGDDWQ